MKHFKNSLFLIFAFLIDFSISCIGFGGCISIGGCGPTCLFGLCIGTPMIQSMGCPCGMGFMCMRGGCIARAAAAGAKTYKDETQISRSHDSRGIKTPDEHLRTCCEILDVAAGCLHMCSYDGYTAEQVVNAIQLHSACPATEINKIHFCAARGTNHTDCCRRVRVPSTCTNFCDQSQNSPEVQLSIEHVQCVDHFDEMKECFLEHAANEYYESGIYSMSEDESQTSMIVSY